MPLPDKAPIVLVALLYLTGQFSESECGGIFDSPTFDQPESVRGLNSAKIENRGGNSFLDFLDNLFGFKQKKATAEPINVDDSDDVAILASNTAEPQNNTFSESVEGGGQFPTQTEDGSITMDKTGKPYNATEINQWLEKGLKSLDSILNFSKVAVMKPTDMTAVDPSTTVEPFTMKAIETHDYQEPMPIRGASDEHGALKSGPPLFEKNVPNLKMNMDSWGNMFKTISEDSIPSRSDENQKKVVIDDNEELETTSDVESSTLAHKKQDDDEILDILSPSNVPVDSVPPESTEIDKKLEGRQKSAEVSLEMSKSSERPTGNGIQLVDSIFCRAKCVEQCVTINGNGFKECQALCKTSSLENLCAQDDTPCLTACSLTAINKNLDAPNITGLKYYKIDEMMDPETTEISWEPVPGAVLYLVSLVADTSSIQAGADYLIQDITNVPWYSFKKPDLCFQYYASVSAVLRDGITPFSQPVFQQSAVRNISDLKVEQRDVAFTNLMLSEFSQARFVDVVLDVFSPVLFDLSKIQMTSYLLASHCDSLKDPAAIFGHYLGGQGEKIAVTNVQFLHAKRQIIARLPLDVVALNCKFEYRIAYMKTRCGNIISYVSNIGATYDSTVGTDFRLNCDSAPFEGCGTPQATSDEKQPIDQSPPSESVDQPIEEQILCNLENFKVDILGSALEGGYNLTVSWDTINDFMPKTYLLSHGSARRNLVQEPPLPTDLDYTPEPLISVFTDASNDPSRMFVKLNHALPANDLHVFQLCTVRLGVAVDSVDWAKAPKHVVDLAAVPIHGGAPRVNAEVDRAMAEAQGRANRPDQLLQPVDPLIRMDRPEPPPMGPPMVSPGEIEARLMGILARPQKPQGEPNGPATRPSELGAQLLGLLAYPDWPQQAQLPNPMARFDGPIGQQPMNPMVRPGGLETQVINFLERAVWPRLLPMLNGPDMLDTQLRGLMAQPDGPPPMVPFVGPNQPQPDTHLVGIVIRPVLPAVQPVGPWARSDGQEMQPTIEISRPGDPMRHASPSDRSSGPDSLENFIETSRLAVDKPIQKDRKSYWASFFDDIENEINPTTTTASPQPIRKKINHDQYISLFGYGVEEGEFLQVIFVLFFLISVISASMFFWFVLRKCCMKKKRLFADNKNPLIFVQHADSMKKPIAFIDVENPISTK